ncbi:MAG TPA: glycoside hydrolase family 2 TIM barrel-domain containing protein [Pseudonocardiaceae bacterium]|nr:glycoside hydrolase family 2 TIM barrel-domain containing protein [Pseudonocardiaceae bacterium]
MDDATGGRPAGPSRRAFLIGLGAGVASATSLGALLFSSTTPLASGPFGDQWLFGEYAAGCADADYDDSRLATVTVPHCVTPLSWRDWQPAAWETLWVYRQHFDAPHELRAGRAFVRLEGVLSAVEVLLNGRRIGSAVGGYLPLTCEMTGLLTAKGNVLAVTVDGRWRQDVPPDRPGIRRPSVIDFYQPAGMYRTATVLATPRTYLDDVFAMPVDVLTDARALVLRCEVDSADGEPNPVRLTTTLSQYGTVLASTSTDLTGLAAGRTAVTMTMTGLAGVRLWDVTDPALCDVLVTLSVGGRQVHSRRVRTGFREALFTEDGCYLNGRPLTLFGVNRHQWYPYVGGAMPDRVQRRDAELLKHELNCTMVRCSHYPQSTAFLDACDELGIMVWEEIPGWDYVGDVTWRDRALADVHDMVVRDRNRPSVIVWGTRVNETLGQLTLYERTDLLAQRLDPSRPCTGAVAGRRGYTEPLYPTTAGGSSVFSFNDYSPLRSPAAAPTLRPPRTGVPYLVSEAIGSLVGHPHYRRVDPVAVQADQALLHAWVHERAAADPRYCGLLAWCGFDYPSGWYHSADGVKYPGVVDVIRIPKLDAAFYQSQVYPSIRPVIEPGFTDLTVHHGHPDLRIDGYVGERMVLRRNFSADPTLDGLSCAADDDTLMADGADATRVVVRAVDRYGAPRPYVSGPVTFAITGPAVLIGDNPFDFAAAGGAGAVWLRTIRGLTGQVVLSASHPYLGTEETTVQVGAGQRRTHGMSDHEDDCRQNDKRRAHTPGCRTNTHRPHDTNQPRLTTETAATSVQRRALPHPQSAPVTISGCRAARGA